MIGKDELGIYLIKYNLRDLNNISMPLPNFAHLMGHNEEEIRNEFDTSERERLIKSYGDNYKVGYAGEIKRIKTPGFKLIASKDSLEEIIDMSNSILTNSN